VKKPSRLTINAMSNVVTFVVAAVVTYFLTPYFIRVLGQTRYGIYALMLTVVGYAGVLNLGIGPAVTRFVAEYLGQGDLAKARRCIKASLSILLVSGSVLVVLAITQADALCGFLNVPPEETAEFRDLIKIMGAIAAVTLLYQLYASVLRAYEKYPVENVIRIGLNIARGVALALTLYYGGNLVSVGYAWLGTLIIALIVLGIVTRLTCPTTSFLPFGADRHVYAALLVYGAAITIISVANVFRFRLGNVIAAKYLNFEDVGLFNIASMIASYLMTAVSVPTGVLLPRFSKKVGQNDKEGLHRLFFNSAKLNAIFACFLGILTLTCSDGFLHLWLKGKYFPQQLDICFYTLSIIVCVYIVGLSQVGSISLIYGLRGERFVTVVNVCEGMAILGLSLWLVQIYGLVGIAMAITIPMAVTKLLIQPAYVARLLKVPLREYYRRCLLGSWILCGLLYGAYGLSRSWLPITNWSSLLILVAVVSIVYCTLAYCLVLNADERRRLPIASHINRIIVKWAEHLRNRNNIT